MKNRKHLVQSEIVYVDNVGSIQVMPVLLAGDSNVVAVSSMLNITVFTMEDDTYLQDSVLSTKRYDLTNKTKSLVHVRRPKSARNSNCIFCAVEEYLLASGHSIFMEECDTGLTQARALFDNPTPVTVVIEQQGDWTLQYGYVEEQLSHTPYSLYISEDGIKDTDVWSVVSRTFNSSVIFNNNVLLVK